MCIRDRHTSGHRRRKAEDLVELEAGFFPQRHERAGFLAGFFSCCVYDERSDPRFFMLCYLCGFTPSSVLVASPGCAGFSEGSSLSRKWTLVVRSPSLTQSLSSPIAWCTMWVERYLTIPLRFLAVTCPMCTSRHPPQSACKSDLPSAYEPKPMSALFLRTFTNT